MKVRIELENDLSEAEVIIRCSQVDDMIQKIHRTILEQSNSTSKITFYKQNQEYYFPIDDVLFFETEGDHIYAHTANDVYLIKHRLYELEELLPRQFARTSKSTIVNTLQVYSITRDLTTSSLIRFRNSHKQVYVSRHYDRQLRQRLRERSFI